MKFLITYTVALVCLSNILSSCKDEDLDISSFNQVNWAKRTVPNAITDTLISGSSYLTVYSEIYSQSEHVTHDLTATISMRNTNRKDTIYIEKAEYFNTKGESIRTYFNKTIFIAPLETVEIVIDEKDKTGGSGANFLFDWKVPSGAHEPYFESVMISTSGQQGLSFATRGVNYK